MSKSKACDGYDGLLAGVSYMFSRCGSETAFGTACTFHMEVSEIRWTVVSAMRYAGAWRVDAELASHINCALVSVSSIPACIIVYLNDLAEEQNHGLLVCPLQRILR